MKINFPDQRFKIFGLAIALGLTAGAVRAEQVFPLGQLDVGKVEQDWGDPRANRSVDGHTLSIGGQTIYERSGHARLQRSSRERDGNAEKFTAQAGVDDEVGPNQGNVQFEVLGDGHRLWQSGLMHGGDAPQAVNVSLDGVKQLTLIAEQRNNSIRLCPR